MPAIITNNHVSHRLRSLHVHVNVCMRLREGELLHAGGVPAQHALYGRKGHARVQQHAAAWSPTNEGVVGPLPSCAALELRAL